MEDIITGVEVTEEPTVVTEELAEQQEELLEDDFIEEEEQGNSEAEEESEEQIEPLEEEDKKPEQKVIDEAVSKRLSEISKQKNEANEEAKKHKEKYEEFLESAKDGIAAFMEEGETVEDALFRLAAENKGLTVEQYKAELQQKKELKTLQESKKAEQAKAVFAKDLSLIKQAYPEVNVEDLKQLSRFSEYAKLMSTNLYTADKAYSIVYADEIANSRQQQKILNESRSHLQSSSPRTIAPSIPAVSKAEMAVWRGGYPNLTDKELIAKIRAHKKNL